MSMSLSFTATHPCPTHATARAERHGVMEWTSGGGFLSQKRGFWDAKVESSSSDCSFFFFTEDLR